MEIDEDGHLRGQHPGVERLGEVIDGAGRVPAHRLVRFTVDGRQEDDRDVPGLLPLLDVGGGGEAVEAGHLHVEEDHGEVVMEEVSQGLVAGTGLDQRVAHRAQDLLQDDQVLGAVVDEKDLGRLAHHVVLR